MSDFSLSEFDEEPRPDEAWRGDSQAREEAAEAALLDLKNPHKWESAALNLTPWQPQRRMTARWWKAEKVIEIVISQIRDRVAQRKKTIRTDQVFTEEEQQWFREEREGESRLRAKGEVRRRLLTIGADHLLTLTYRELMTDLTRAEEDLRRFLKLVRQRYPQYPYVAVWELQKRGAIHWHLGVPGFQNVRLLRKCWCQVVGKENGNIDVTPPRGKNPPMPPWLAISPSTFSKDKKPAGAVSIGTGARSASRCRKKSTGWGQSVWRGPSRLAKT